MQTEIEVKIILDEDYRIAKTELGVNVDSPVSYEAMDYILYDAFNTLANKFADKLNHHNHKENN
jgi:hypothetical protein